MDRREMRALHIAATTQLQPNNGSWKVPSQTGEGSYRVVVTGAGTWACTCPDHEERLADCKHIMAVEITAQREAGKRKVTYTEMVKVTYSQNWSAYNAAQTGEKEMFLSLAGRTVQHHPTAAPSHRTAPAAPLRHGLRRRLEGLRPVLRSPVRQRPSHGGSSGPRGQGS